MTGYMSTDEQMERIAHALERLADSIEQSGKHSSGEIVRNGRVHAPKSEDSPLEAKG